MHQLATDNQHYDSNSNLWILMATVALALLFSVAYFDSIRVLLVLWFGLEEVSDNSGILALACTFYLLYLKKNEFKAAAPKPNYFAGFVLLLFSLLWFIAKSIDLQSAHIALLPFIFLAAITFALGNQYLRLSFIPVLILLFVIPIWWPLLPYLREITTFVTHLNLDLINRPVFVQGYSLHLPGGSFLIDESCSGLRFLTVTVLLSFVCMDVFRHTWARFLSLLCVGILLALLANWIRVLVIVLIGDYTLMESSLVDDHANLGWIIYGVVVLVPFYLVNHWLSNRDDSAGSENSEHSSSTVFVRLPVTFFLLSCVLLSAGPILAYSLERSNASGSGFQLPLAIEPVEMVSEELTQAQQTWRPQFLNASQYLDIGYEMLGDRVEAHIVHYKDQRQGAELINVENVFADEISWFERDSSVVQIRDLVDEGSVIDIQALQLSDTAGERILVWYWYQVGGRHAIEPFSAKLLEILAMFSGRTDATLISVSSKCELGCAETAAILNQFVRIMYPSLSRTGD